MSYQFGKIPLRQRIAPWFSGFDGPLAFAVFMLACAGLLTMYSSGYDHGTRFEDHARNMLIAGTIMFVVAQIPPQRLMLAAVPLYTVGVALLIAVAVFGITKKGAKRWVNIGVVIQPSEILKIAMPLMLAWWFQKREGQLRPLDFVVAGGLLAVPVGLIMKQPDLGTALLVLAAGMAVIFFAGMSWKLVIPPLALGLVGIFLIVFFEPQLCADGVRWPVLHDYQQQRICTLLDPTRDPLGKGFHIIQGMIAIGSGGVTGMGFMKGTQTHLEFIPERTTDFRGVRTHWHQLSDLRLHLFGAARFGDCTGGADLVLPLVGRSCHHDFLHLCLCEHGHGQRHSSCGGGAFALYQLWWNGHGDPGAGAGHSDVDCQLQAPGAELNAPSLGLATPRVGGAGLK
jgi:rod shape determining protein RodA